MDRGTDPRRVVARWKRVTRSMAVVVIGLEVATGAVMRAAAPEVAEVPLPTYLAQLGSAEQIARGCANNSKACTAPDLPGLERVQGSPNGPFTANWQWFADTLAGAKGASERERVSAMVAAEAHLFVLAAQSSQAEDPRTVELAKARMAANAALARDEFRTVEGPGWLARKLARLQDGILQLLNSMNRLGERAPWLAPLIEWSCFGLAVAGLLWFVRQNLARQALRISLTEGALLTGTGGRKSEDWERLAEEQAQAQSWREAVHSVYWAGIALLEGRRAWRPDPTRTPREYVRLLRPGTEAQRALRELTRGLERVWYGLEEADEEQYRTARANLEALRTAKPERAGPPAGAQQPGPWTGAGADTLQGA